MNLRELVESQAEIFKEKVFLYWKDTTISYRLMLLIKET